MKRRPKGTGGVVKRGSKFLARSRANGKLLYGPLRNTKDEALQDLLSQNWAENGPRSPRLADWSIECLEGAYGRSIAEATWNTNAQIHKQYIEPSPIAEVPIHEITERQYQQFIDGIIQSPSRVHRVHAYLRKLASLARKQRLIKENFAESAILPKIRAKSGPLPSITAYKKAFECQTWVDLMITLSVLTAMRRGEIVRLQSKHFDFTRMQIHVPGSKNNQSVRIVPIPEFIGPLLAQKVRAANGYLFPGLNGHIRADYASRKARERCNELGIPAEIKPLQGGRQVWTTTAYEEGAHPNDVQSQLGHTTPTMALKHYLKSNLTRQKHVSDLVSKKAKTN